MLILSNRLLIFIYILTIVLMSGFFKNADACTAFVLRNGSNILFGEGFDWYTDEGIVSINKIGIAKSSILEETQHKTAYKWNSRYASVTFSWIGISMPLCGMNDQGLAITSLLFKDSKLPVEDERPELSISQWKQYILDTCQNVEQVFDTLASVRISTNSQYGTHYLIADASGSTAVIQFIDGKPKIYEGKNLPFPVITNDLYYDDALHRINNIKIPDDSKHISKKIDNYSRFQRVVQFLNLIETYNFDLEKMASDIFDSVRIPGHTQWNIVFDLKNLSVSFTTRKNPKKRLIFLNQLDLTCHSPIMLMDINNEEDGNVGLLFKSNSLILNDEILEKSNRILRLDRATLNGLMQYAGRLKCSDLPQINISNRPINEN